MSELKRETLKVGEQRAVLVGVFTPADRVERDADGSRDSALDELAGLVEAAGATVVGRMTQVMDKPHGATCVGSGTVAELKNLLERTDANLIAFDSDLTPAQGRNIEKETDCVVVDRSEVILDIFASRARTYESKLQVELAQLLYMRPRLTRMWTHLERIASGAVGSARGPGEKQLELDRRLIDTRIAELRRKLKEVEKRREREAGQRSEHKTVSLVGYTNAGKSTLMRAVTGEEVYVADQLFATLDTRTRTWFLPAYGEALLSDTVGFVDKLPHHLVASFKSTLEEARQADLMLHVVDAGDPEVENHIRVVRDVLEELEITDTPTILVFNKTDTVQDRSRIDALRATYEDSVSVSAAAGDGLDRLARVVADRLGGGFVETTLRVEPGNGKAQAYLRHNAKISETRFDAEEILLDVVITRDRLRFATSRLDASEEAKPDVPAATPSEAPPAVSQSA